ncbi:MAG TPA: C1 family peptidase [Ignavibacteriaceae bacterium]|nr:C1 family peptidase [Ignavibacteriaceae bacterium]
MKYSVLILTCLMLALSYINTPAQVEKDKGVFVEPKKGFYDEIKEAVKNYNNPPKEKKNEFRVDMSNINAPKSIDEFTKYWYNDPISQGQTGTCWSFSTTSFFESEVYRRQHIKVKLSEIFTVYWEYVEKAKRFVEERGNSLFDEGSEANAVKRIYKMYGAVPEASYACMLSGQKFPDHSIMIKEMKDYLDHVKATNAWDEDEVIKVIKSILSHYLGEPPTQVEVDGKTYTPKEYLSDYLKLNPDDYVDVLSYMQKPYWQQVDYEVPDNWWHNADYFNVPLDDFMNALNKAIKNGYTMSIGGDVSEPGYDAWNKIAIVPSFDIPAQYIDENAREFRFNNKTTTDDHGIHMVGYTDKNGVMWYLIKDSGSGSRNTGPKGYYFFREDYVKLKMMDFMVHKDAVKDLLAKFQVTLNQQ